MLVTAVVDKQTFQPTSLTNQRTFAVQAHFTSTRHASNCIQESQAMLDLLWPNWVHVHQSLAKCNIQMLAKSGYHRVSSDLVEIAKLS